MKYTEYFATGQEEAVMQEEKDYTVSPLVERNYKDTVFRMLFREKSALLSLYNAVNGTDSYTAFCCVL